MWRGAERGEARLKNAIWAQSLFWGSDTVCGREGVVQERCGEVFGETEKCDFAENSILGERSSLSM